MTKIYDCTAKVISPVHIGSGDSYGASEYTKSRVKYKGEIIPNFNKINIGKYYRDLDENNKDKFIQNLSDPDFSLEQLDTKVSNDYREYIAFNYCENNPRPNQVIQENIKTLKKSYIPGSSLKGAIKSALFYNVFNINDVPDIVKLIHRGKKGPYIQNYAYGKFIDRYFSGNIKKAPNTSIMKFLYISDSSAIDYPQVYDVFTVMASNSGMKNGNQLYDGGARSFLETIGSDLELNFKITNNYDKRYSGLKLKGKEELIELDYIKSAIYDFSKDLINYEIDFCKKYGIDYLLDFYENIKDSNTPSKPLIRIGGGSGFLATTIGMKVLEYGGSYMENIRKTIKTKTYPNFFPKSRKVVANDNGSKCPLGWVKLSFKELYDE